MSTATKTFRARSLTDALAQVRDELGPDAVVVRRREALEGGVAGFFQKAVVEIEAQPGMPRLELTEGEDAPIVPDPEPAPIQMAPGLARGAAAAGFAAALATAESTPATQPEDDAHRGPLRPHVDAAVDAIPQPRDSAPEVVPVVTVPSAAFVPEPIGAPAPTGTAVAVRADHAETERVQGTLRRAGLSEAFSAAVLDEATIHGLPFAGEGHTALRPLVARAVARRLTVAPVTGARAVAIVGAGGSGKTAVIARLALAYAAAGRLPVAVIALRSKDSGAELARLLAPAGVPMWATDDVEGAAARIANLRRGALVLVDTPALPAQMSADPFVTDALVADLHRLGLDEVHLALPAVLAGEVARELLAAAGALGADRIAVTHTDATARLGMAVELAVEAGLPISYLVDSVGVRPAAAEDLAFALLP
jgi:flagellar biosynthesis protein FlhF